jgi:hypothetical protein
MNLSQNKLNPEQACDCSSTQYKAEQTSLCPCCSVSRGVTSYWRLRLNGCSGRELFRDDTLILCPVSPK